jgi:hypothetical protein
MVPVNENLLCLLPSSPADLIQQVDSLIEFFLPLGIVFRVFGPSTVMSLMPFINPPTKTKRGDALSPFVYCFFSSSSVYPPIRIPATFQIAPT